MEGGHNDEDEAGSDFKKRKRNTEVAEMITQEVELHGGHGFYCNNEGGKVSVTRNNPLYDSQDISADPGDVQDCREL